jgi:hypothetical protein
MADLRNGHCRGRNALQMATETPIRENGVPGNGGQSLKAAATGWLDLDPGRLRQAVKAGVLLPHSKTSGTGDLVRTE